MAAYWNIPVIGYMASGTKFADKTIYKTLARVSLRTTNSLAQAVASLLKHFGWQKVSELIDLIISADLDLELSLNWTLCHAYVVSSR
ncbi:unnamed protein product [Anisakis simplex]|uniref:ANF_receptor domain-containing protein n=1 Tax=Anisakis simplex TaxID=6269 RepID=A0A0M3JLD2_ANISI|nr:unnamed protein product [Anisakis simplex]